MPTRSPASRPDRNLIFGYASLLDPELPVPPPRPARLRGRRRGWGVAMDNRRTIPGYKVYVDPASGEQPPVYVAYLDLEDDPGAWVNGALIVVDDDLLAGLDRRERSYERHEVTPFVDADVDGPVWAYVGRPEARERLRRGRADGTAVVSRAYHDKVRADFAALGAPMLRDFDRTTAPLTLPLVELVRVDLDPDGRRPAEGLV